MYSSDTPSRQWKTAWGPDRVGRPSRSGTSWLSLPLLNRRQPSSRKIPDAEVIDLVRDFERANANSHALGRISSRVLSGRDMQYNE
jgi:hypothetical protein